MKPKSPQYKLSAGFKLSLSPGEIFCSNCRLPVLKVSDCQKVHDDKIVNWLKAAERICRKDICREAEESPVEKSHTTMSSPDLSRGSCAQRLCLLRLGLSKRVILHVAETKLRKLNYIPTPYPKLA